jgi:hypothetical protein
MMKAFSISRLQTSLGIFRLEGKYEGAHSQQRVQLSRIEVMGTDGWVELDINFNSTQKLVIAINNEVVSHLLEKDAGRNSS